MRWEIPKYHWSLFLYNETEQTWHPNHQLSHYSDTGITTSSLVLHRKTLIGGRLYRLRLDVDVWGYDSTFSEYELKTNLPPYGGNCSINPTNGYALETKFKINCMGWKNPEDEETGEKTQLIYRFWSFPRGAVDHDQLLYYGPDPFTPESQFPLGSKYHHFIIDVAVRIANPLGEFIETYLEVMVTEPPETDLEDLYEITSGENSQLASMLDSGQTQEAKQMIVALASLLNTEPVYVPTTIASTTEATTKPTTIKTTTTTTVSPTGPDDQVTIASQSEANLNDTKTLPTTTTTTLATTIKTTSTTVKTTTTTRTTTTTLPPTTTLDPVALKEKQQKEEEQKQKRIQLRTNIIITLATTQSYTLDSLQQTAMAMKVITQETDEVSETSQNITMTTMRSMAADLDLMLHDEASTEQAITTASDIISSIGNVVAAAKENIESKTEAEQEVPSDEDSSDSPDVIEPVENEASYKEEAKTSHEDKVRIYTNTAYQVADEVATTVLRRQLAGQTPVKMQSKLFTLLIERHHAGDINNTELVTSGGSMKLPPASDIFGSNYTQLTVDTKMISTNSNPFIWDESAKHINFSVLTLTLADQNGQDYIINETNKDFVINIKLNESMIPEGKYVVPDIPDYQKLYYHSFYLTNNDSILQIEITPDDPDLEIEVYIRYGKLPTIEKFDLNFTLPNEMNDTDSADATQSTVKTEMRHSVFLPIEYIRSNGNDDMYFMGIRVKTNQTVEQEYEEDYYSSYVYNDNHEKFPNFTIRLASIGCRFWNKDIEKWISDGCKVSPESSSQFTRCLCNHLTSFGADFFVPPNTINFSVVFDDLLVKLKDNNAVLITVGVIFGLYLIVLVWARRKDKKDIAKWGVTPLCDNIAGEHYYYQLSVYTGLRKGSGTKSNVTVVLSGDDADTGVRLLQDYNNRHFERGSVNHYLMSVPDSLGPLSYLRVWHDNTGKGKYASWFLDRVVVTDLQTLQSFFFLGNTWLAVEEGDGQIDRVLPVAGHDDITSFSNLFVTSTRKRLTDSHLWISVVSRPTRSYFTRVQRVSCILSLIFTTMIANAMFYQSDEKVEQIHVMSIGPFRFALHQLWVSLASSFIILPINLIIDQIFRRSVPKSKKIIPEIDNRKFFGKIKLNNWQQRKQRTIEKRDIKLNEIEVKANENVENIKNTQSYTISTGPLRPSTRLADLNHGNFITKDATNNSTLFEYNIKDDQENVISDQGGCGTPQVTEDLALKEVQKITNSIDESKKKKKKVKLPFWCAYIGWLLLVATTAASAFFTVTYSLEWGKEKSEAWLTAMVLSIVESVVVIQPVKIILIALSISLFVKKPELDEDVADNDKNSTLPQNDEEIIDTHPRKRFREKVAVTPPDDSSLAEAREKRLKEVEMHRVVREVIAYCVFLSVLLCLAHYNIDTRSYRIKEGVRHTLWNSYPAFYKIKDPETMWGWIGKILVPALYPVSYYNHDPLKQPTRITGDMVSYRLGPPRLRQLRNKPGLCHLPPQMRYTFIECNTDYGFGSEDKKQYKDQWQRISRNLTKSSPRMSPWRYRDSLDIGGVPHPGKLYVYNGGGYILDFMGSVNMANRFTSEIKNTKWIDKYSRAVFIEFTVYNPNVNLFTMVTFLMEFPVSGGCVHSFEVSSFKLLSYIGGSSAFVLVAEIVYVFVVFYYLGSVVRRMKRLGMKMYFKEMWNTLDLLMVVAAFTAIILYVGRHAYSLYALQQVKNLKGTFYNFRRLATWSDIFSVTIGVVCFISILRLIHLLRFNRRMSMLSSTLCLAAGDMVTFSVVFLVVVLAYAQFAYLIFGRHLVSYSSFVTTLETLLSTSLGGFNYNDLCQTSSLLGPIYFFSFVLVMVFALMNMFISIINDTFTMVKNDINLQSNEYEILDFMWARFQTWTGVDFSEIFKRSQQKRQKQQQNNLGHTIEVNVPQKVKQALWDPCDSKKDVNLDKVDSGIKDIHVKISRLYQDVYKDFENEDDFDMVEEFNENPTKPSYTVPGTSGRFYGRFSSSGLDDIPDMDYLRPGTSMDCRTSRSTSPATDMDYMTDE